MPSFGRTSKMRLSEAHPEQQVLWNEVIKEIDCTIVCVFRGQEDQNKAYQDGYSQLRWPDSKHNVKPSMAVDACPYSVEIGNIDWEDAKAMCVLAGVVKCVNRRLLREGVMTMRVRWGGDWDADGRTVDQKFHDLPHYELVEE